MQVMRRLKKLVTHGLDDGGIVRVFLLPSQHDVAGKVFAGDVIHLEIREYLIADVQDFFVQFERGDNHLFDG